MTDLISLHLKINACISKMDQNRHRGNITVSDKCSAHTRHAPKETVPTVTAEQFQTLTFSVPPANTSIQLSCQPAKVVSSTITPGTVALNHTDTVSGFALFKREKECESEDDNGELVFHTMSLLF